MLWKRIGKEKSIALSDDFLKTPNLVFLESTEQVIHVAHKIVNDFGLNPRDAIHAATALLNNCTEIASDDPDFDNVKGLKRMKV